MTLTSGTKLGSYEVQSPLGAGGMGEVYRARDSKLNRDIALKVLPELFAKDAERMARFQREAQLLASLNHPNIGVIHGCLEADGTDVLVLELVEGEDLAQRLKRGALPPEEAMALAKQIAAGLEAAHDKGIVHRDLKPGNIKITKDGTAKILDFGLAKALEDAPEARDLRTSPTVSIAETRAGIVLGTAAYMSPEQARGQAVDKRTDIWAFGAVLFEMLTGKNTFAGDSVSDTLAAILRSDPDWSLLPPSVSPGIRASLRHCLERDPKKRLRDIGDLRLVLEEAEKAGASSDVTPPANAVKRLAPWAIAAVSVFVAVWMLLSRSRTETATHGVTHLDLSYPQGVEPVYDLPGGFTVSPDGRMVAMIGVKDGVRRLYVRRLDRPEPVEIPGTAGANSAAFSPDSQSVAFVPGSAKLTRVSLTDQQRTVVVPGVDLTSVIAWGERGIFYTKEGKLWYTPPQGGPEQQLTTLDERRHEVLHTEPLLLPGGRTILFTSMTSDAGSVRIEAVSATGGPRRVIIENAGAPTWSRTGHLLFGRDGAVMAVPFDPSGVSVKGTAVPVIPAGIVNTESTGFLGLSLSTTGTLVFLPTDFESKRVISVGRDGSEFGLNLPAAAYANPRMSPDGHRLLIASGGTSLDAFDLLRGTVERIAPDALGTSFGTWTADSKGVVFRRFNVPFWTAADGSGKSGPVPGGILNDFPSAPGPDADSILAVRIQPETSGDIVLLSISGQFQPKQLIATPAYEGGAEVSPDGRWLLYQSNASGQSEIYVRRYPALERAWPVSEGGGVQARWSATGKEIYYRNGHSIMAVSFGGTGTEPSFGKPAALFADQYDFGAGISIANYDVTRDGRFIMLRRSTGGGTFRVVMNWTEELKQTLAVGGVH